MTIWTNSNMAGFLPWILQAVDPRPARDQLDDRYSHGGGYRPRPGFTNLEPDSPATIQYPGDPTFHEVARSSLPITGETLILFDSSFMAIVQKDGSWAITRVD